MSNLKEILINKKICKSVWFMRQAGRYLPEFREIRAKNKDFIKLCLNSELSSKITLQPIERFNLDAAIIFSDILMIPYALGQGVAFEKDQGPKLTRFDINIFLNNDEKKFSNKLSPIYKAIEITRKKLNKEKSLISFIGAPWTLLIYMLNLRNDYKGLHLDKLNMDFDLILEKLNKYLCIHIKNQINAGSDVVQIFDSWAGLIPFHMLDNFCFTPNKQIVDFCKKENIPSICFPKGLKQKYEDFNNFVTPNGINLDSEIDPIWAKERLKNVVIQGGLDPNILLKSDEEIIKGATKYIQAFKDTPYIFNLGHGLLPETDPDKLQMLIKIYRDFNG